MSTSWGKAREYLSTGEECFILRGLWDSLSGSLALEYTVSWRAPILWASLALAESRSRGPDWCCLIGWSPYPVLRSRPSTFSCSYWVTESWSGDSMACLPGHLVTFHRYSAGSAIYFTGYFGYCPGPWFADCHDTHTCRSTLNLILHECDADLLTISEF